MPLLIQLVKFNLGKPSNVTLMFTILIFSPNFRYSRQKISLEDENEDSSKTSNDKDRNANDNNNIEGQENLNKLNTPQCAPEKSTTDEKEWSPSSDSTNSVEDDQGNMVPWREKLQK